MGKLCRKLTKTYCQDPTPVFIIGGVNLVSLYPGCINGIRIKCTRQVSVSEGVFQTSKIRQKKSTVALLIRQFHITKICII